MKDFFQGTKHKVFQNEAYKIFPFLKIQLLSEYSNNAVSDLTATFASQEAKSIDDLIKMKPD